MQRCKFCDKPLSEGDYYVSRPTACKGCVKAAVRANYAKNRAHYHAYERKRAQDPKRKADALRHQRARRRRNPEKEAARRAVAYHKGAGSLRPGPCADCGATDNVEAHHEDYSRPLEVEWLCFACHRGRHGQEVSACTALD